MNPPLPLAWRDALAAVPFETFTPAEKAAGWPQALTPAQLARLQRPYTDRKDRNAHRACQALEQTIAEAVASGALPHTVQEHSTPESWKEVTNAPDPFAAYFGDQGFASREWLDRDSRSGVTIRQRIPAKSWQTHHITAQAARAWLAAQGEAPSPHVAAWFAGAGLQPTEVGAPAAAAPQPAPAKETAEQRQDRRLQMCIDAGLTLPKNEHGRMPDGIAKVAEREGIHRTSFTTDVKAAIARRNAIRAVHEQSRLRVVPKR